MPPPRPAADNTPFQTRRGHVSNRLEKPAGVEPIDPRQGGECHQRPPVHGRDRRRCDRVSGRPPHVSPARRFHVRAAAVRGRCYAQRHVRDAEPCRRRRGALAGSTARRQRHDEQRGAKADAVRHDVSLSGVHSGNLKRRVMPQGSAGRSRRAPRTLAGREYGTRIEVH